MFDRRPRGLASGLSKLAELFGLQRRDEHFFEQLEDALIEADVGARVALEIVERLEAERVSDGRALALRVKELLLGELRAAKPQLVGGQPAVLLVLGVNGVGKTTTAAKLAYYYKHTEGMEDVMLCAADTFRAAAIDQLRLLGERLGVRVAAQQPGADPAAVIYDAIASARARRSPLVIVDTAGRMHSKADLVRELVKVDKVVKARLEGGPYHKALVIDATTGQNALQQAEVFHQAVHVDSVIIAKSDSTAKGGIVVPLSRTLRLPFSFVGTGERLEDLEPFDAAAYLDALLGLR